MGNGGASVVLARPLILLSELLQQPPPPASPEQSAQTPSTNAWASLDASRLQGL